MLRILFTLFLLLLPLQSFAQADSEETSRDRSFLTGLIEDNLSGAGRTIRLEGFEGALSSRATFDLLTIADEEGVWISIRNGAISWDRSALLSGRIDIEELSAEMIELPRAPIPEGPSPETTEFSLPELPVSVFIGVLKVDRLSLGEPLLGLAIEASVDGTMELGGGEGSAELDIVRIDGPTGKIAFKGSYANETRMATLDLLVTEDPGGIAATLLDLPGDPAIELAISGDGVLDDFAADIALSTDGTKRLGGTVTIGSETADTGEVERTFAVNITGDIAPLVLADYQEFFGDNVTLEAVGRLPESGAVRLTRLVVDSDGIDVTGRLSLSPNGLPTEAALTARLGYSTGQDVLLPIPGDKTFVRAGDLKLRFDSANEDGWTLDGTLHGLRRSAIRIGDITLEGSGRISAPGADGVEAARVGGQVNFRANAIEPTDAALASAIGPQLAGQVVFAWEEGGALELPTFDVTGQGYSATADLTLSGIDSDLRLDADVAANIADMARFSRLAGRDLGGSADFEGSGHYEILTGEFDLEGQLTGRDLRTGQAELDSLLAGRASVSVSAARGPNGIDLRRLELTARSLNASAAGQIATGKSDLNASLDFSDLSVLGQQYRGALSADARLTESGSVRNFSVDGTLRDLGVGVPAVSQILAGTTTLALRASEQSGRITLQSVSLENAQLSANADGDIDGADRRLNLDARLNDLALLAPGFPGPLTLQGTISDSGADYAIDVAGDGPGGTSAQVSGSVAQDFASADLSVTGSAQSAIINPFIRPRDIQGPISFDLRLDGPMALGSISGRVTLADARLVAPALGVELEALNVAADLSGGQTNLDARGSVRGGGQIALSGPVSLTAPFNGDLSVTLNDVNLRDPDLFETIVDGALTVRGPLTGGATIIGDITLARTEIRIPSNGFGARPSLDGLVHVNEPAPVHSTRRKAGLTQDARGSSSDGRGGFNIDVTISAPGRIFVRGRGLDAEMDGSLRLTGTTENIIPSGQFNLVRGRLDILGKRFTIDQGLVELQGALTPYIRFNATTESEGVTVTIVIEGEASSPDIRFLSSPELPEEEVVAQLLFGRSLTSLSPFQAAQLASAVATLAGKGGEGIVSKLRNSFGLDDLDVTTDADGNAGVRAGKYLSENLYTDVEIGSGGKSEINLNLDVRPGVTIKGGVGSDGSTGIGIYFERDY